MTVKNHGTAPMYTTRKDHKAFEDQEKGPPVRPICGANAGYNSKLSHLISTLIKPLHTRDTNECNSTEDLLANISQLNNNATDTEYVIGSLDVKALYPSLNIEATASIVAESYYENDYNIEGIAQTDLGLYLSLNKTEDELKRLGIYEHCPKRKTRLGRPPTITGCAVTKQTVAEQYKPWHIPNTTPDDATIKRMMSEALKIVILFIMNNHIYQFENTMKKQSEGGPIGLDLTGELANIYMAWWDRQLLTRLNQHNIELMLYKRYFWELFVVLTQILSC